MTFEILGNININVANKLRTSHTQMHGRSKCTREISLHIIFYVPSNRCVDVTLNSVSIWQQSQSNPMLVRSKKNLTTAKKMKKKNRGQKTMRL